MGFDVTFHPVSAGELQHFVFDVLNDPAILDARVTELTKDDDVRARVRLMFEQTIEAIDRDPDADYLDDDEDEDQSEDDDEDNGPPDDMIRFVAATVAGCLHPYWVARGAGLSLARRKVNIPETFQPLGSIGKGRIQTIPDEHGGAAFYENYTATGFMLPADVASLARRLSGDAKLSAALGTWGMNSLGSALRYAAERGLGLIEATDLFTMMGSVSDPRNLRGIPSRPVAAASPPTPIECPACGVINTPGSKRCDCGHDLTGPAPDRPRARLWIGIVLIVVAVVWTALQAVFGDVNFVNVVMVTGSVAWAVRSVLQSRHQ